MLIHDWASESTDVNMLEVKGCIYGEIQHAVPTLDLSYLKGEKLRSLTSRVRECIATECGLIPFLIESSGASLS